MDGLIGTDVGVFLKSIDIADDVVRPTAYIVGGQTDNITSSVACALTKSIKRCCAARKFTINS